MGIQEICLYELFMKTKSHKLSATCPDCNGIYNPEEQRVDYCKCRKSVIKEAIKLGVKQYRETFERLR